MKNFWQGLPMSLECLMQWLIQTSPTLVSVLFERSIIIHHVATVVLNNDCWYFVFAKPLIPQTPVHHLSSHP